MFAEGGLPQVRDRKGLEGDVRCQRCRDECDIERARGAIAATAIDARTGAPRWEWDPIPRTANDPVAPTWQGVQPPTEGHANAWAPMATDGRALEFPDRASRHLDYDVPTQPGLYSVWRDGALHYVVAR